MAEIEKFELKAIDGTVPGPGMLRLVSVGKNAVALASQTILMSLGAETQFHEGQLTGSSVRWIPFHTVEEVVPAMPTWDGIRHNDKIEIVYERYGGAVKAIILTAPSAEPKNITSAYPVNSFAKPRFAKSGSEPPRWVTAIVDSRMCVALPLFQIGKYRELGECSEGLLVKAENGYLFIYKTDVPGTVRGVSTMPGRLHLRLLDSELQPTGLPVDVSGETIFEFDAALANRKLIVIATTTTGLFIAATEKEQSLIKLHIENHAASTTLANPAVVAIPSAKILMAALDYADPQSPKLVSAALSN